MQRPGTGANRTQIQLLYFLWNFALPNLNVYIMFGYGREANDCSTIEYLLLSLFVHPLGSWCHLIYFAPVASIYSFHGFSYMSRVMRKQTFCICENKDADQLRGNREADQRLCFRYIDCTIPLLSKSQISSL